MVGCLVVCLFVCSFVRLFDQHGLCDHIRKLVKKYQKKIKTANQDKNSQQQNDSKDVSKSLVSFFSVSFLLVNSGVVFSVVTSAFGHLSSMTFRPTSSATPMVFAAPSPIHGTETRDIPGRDG